MIIEEKFLIEKIKIYYYKKKEKSFTISARIFLKWEEETIAFSAASNLSIFTVREYLFSCGHRNKKKNDRPTNCPILVVIHRRVSKSSKSKEETAFLQLRNCRYLPFFEKRLAIYKRMINLTSLLDSFYISSKSRFCNVKTLEFLSSRIFLANFFLFIYFRCRFEFRTR